CSWSRPFQLRSRSGPLLQDSVFPCSLAWPSAYGLPVKPPAWTLLNACATNELIFSERRGRITRGTNKHDGRCSALSAAVRTDDHVSLPLPSTHDRHGRRSRLPRGYVPVEA